MTRQIEIETAETNGKESWTDSEDLIRRDHEVVSPAIYRYTDIAFAHGKGVFLYDFEGKRYYDMAAGIATMAASLSFVGLGAVPPTPEWGAMIAAGRHKFFEWWMAAFPGLAIFTTVVGFNFLGDGLRDLLDPRLSRLA